MSWPKRLNSRGDTIVEVLIVLAVLGLAFAISSATASRGLQQSRNAQEHSQALGLLTTQLELLRAATSQQFDLSTSSNAGTGFCIPDPANPEQTKPSTDASCLQNSLYRESIKYVNAGGATPYYQLEVDWEGIGTLGNQRELMTYRIYPLTSTIGSGISLQNSAPEIDVYVPVHLPQNDSSNPSCSSSRLSSLSGLSIVLNPGSQSATTDGSSVAQFTDLSASSSYSAKLDASSVPTGVYSVCPPPDSGAAVSPGNPKVISLNGIVPFGWATNGSAYLLCSQTDPFANDRFDGCFRSGTSMYAWRDFAAIYKTLTFPIKHAATLVIDYGQYGGGCDSGYSFKVTAKMTGVSVPLNLPMCQNRLSTTINVPAGTSNILLQWTNNSFTPSGLDANLQINSVQLYYQ